MLRDADTGSQDGQIFMDLGTEALDEGTMERYIREYSLWQMKGSFEKPVVKEAFWEELGALAKDGKGQYHVTAAGLLMFGKKEQIIKKFPRFLLKYEEYGREAEEEIRYEPSKPDFAEAETTEVMHGGWTRFVRIYWRIRGLRQRPPCRRKAERKHRKIWRPG